MDKSRRNYQLLIEAGSRTFEEVNAGVPATLMLQIPADQSNLFSIDFDVNRNALSSANTSSIKIYNLAETTRNQIYKDQYQLDVYKGIELKAGYGDNIPTIFKGNINQAYSVREGVNFITSTECYDGGFAFLNGNTSTSFPAGTPQNVILEAILRDLPGVNRGAVGIFPKVTTRGNSISGNTADLIQTLSGAAMFVDLEKVYVLGDDECIIGSLLVIDSTIGLLGTPRREKTIINFDMIFEPRLLIGQAVLLLSTTSNYSGLYKVISLHHRGMISDTVCGTAITSVGLWAGTSVLRPVA